MAEMILWWTLFRGEGEVSSDHLQSREWAHINLPGGHTHLPSDIIYRESHEQCHSPDNIAHRHVLPAAPHFFLRYLAVHQPSTAVCLALVDLLVWMAGCLRAFDKIALCVWNNSTASFLFFFFILRGYCTRFVCRLYIIFKPPLCSGDSHYLC